LKLKGCTFIPSTAIQKQNFLIFESIFFKTKAMFTSFNKLNEGGCDDTPKSCRKNELHEGLNPKVTERVNQLRRWPKGKDLSHKNSRWEKLR